MILSISAEIFFKCVKSPPGTSAVSQPPLWPVSRTAFMTTGQLLSPSRSSTLKPSLNPFEFMFSRLNSLMCSRMIRDFKVWIQCSGHPYRSTFPISKYQPTSGWLSSSINRFASTGLSIKLFQTFSRAICTPVFSAWGISSLIALCEVM